VFQPRRREIFDHKPPRFNRGTLNRHMPIKYIPRIIGLKLIKLYQQTLSPDHGPLARLYPNGYCKFHPTCSEYTFQAVEKYGLMRGSLLGCWRVLRCNPWSEGGNDPVK